MRVDDSDQERAVERTGVVMLRSGSKEVWGEVRLKWEIPDRVLA